MQKKYFFVISAIFAILTFLLFLIIGILLISADNHQEQQVHTENNGLLGAYLGIHLEVVSQEDVAFTWKYMVDLIDLADQYGHKFTFFISPPWAEFFLDNPEALAQMRQWASEGHELGTHHHSTEHLNWDGYSNKFFDRRLDGYLGNMDDFMELMNQIPEDGNMLSGAMMNPEQDWPPQLSYNAYSLGSQPSKKNLTSTITTPTYLDEEIKQLTKMAFAVDQIQKDQLTVEEVVAAVENANNVYMGIVINDSTISHRQDDLEELFEALVPYSISFQTLSSLLDENDEPEIAQINPETTEQEDTLPLYFTTMTHMEGGWTDNKNKFQFDRHVTQLRNALKIGQPYGAKLTIESESEFAEANEIWEVNIMQEIVDAGWGVNTHCDVGLVGQYGEEAKDLYTYEQAIEDISYNKKVMDALVGASENLACSGAGGYFDWVTALIEVGFKYKNSVVGMGMLAIPEENRPDNGLWTDQYITSGGGFHVNAPINLMDRIYLMRLKNLDDWIHDPDGELVISNGAMGSIQAMAETYGQNTSSCGPNCSFTKEDIDILVETIQDVNENRDPNQIAKLNLYIASNYLGSDYNEELEYFFSEMQKLENEGIIVWATQKEVYEHYVALNPIQS